MDGDVEVVVGGVEHDTSLEMMCVRVGVVMVVGDGVTNYISMGLLVQG